MATKKCEVCEKPAVWYGQQMEGPDNRLTFTAPGWHYRGFVIHPICDECRQRLQNLTAKEWAIVINRAKEN